MHAERGEHQVESAPDPAGNLAGRYQGIPGQLRAECFREPGRGGGGGPPSDARGSDGSGAFEQPRDGGSGVGLVEDLPDDISGRVLHQIDHRTVPVQDSGQQIDDSGVRTGGCHGHGILCQPGPPKFDNLRRGGVANARYDLGEDTCDSFQPLLLAGPVVGGRDLARDRERPGLDRRMMQGRSQG